MFENIKTRTEEIEMDLNKVAYIFRDVGGWFVCEHFGPLHTDGRGFSSKNAAIATLRELRKCGATDYTHYRTGKSPVARAL